MQIGPARATHPAGRFPGGARGTCLRVLALVLFLAGAACARGADAPSPGEDRLLAGAATSVITPPIGTVMNGGTAPAISTHVHDELHARAIVLAQGSNRLAFVQLDTCLVDRPLMDVMKERIRLATGLQPEQVCIAATHTHSGGSLTGVHLAEADENYRRWVPGPVTDAVRRALHNLAPAEFAWGRGTLPQHVFNRRIRIKAGVTYTNLLGKTGDQVKMNWSSPSPEDADFGGPVDPEVQLLSLRHDDGRPLALLANYSLHYVGGTGPGELSADYFGEFGNRISDLLGASRQDPPFVPVLSNGTSGDINNIDFRRPRSPRPPYAQIHLVADDLAREVRRVLRGLSYTNRVGLAFARADIQVRYRKPNAAEVESARRLLAGRTADKLRSWPEIHARDQVLLAAYPDEALLPVQVFRIGPVRIAQWPGEIFAESGLALKRFSEPVPLMNISLANGWFGYIPPPGQHEAGAYETWRLRSSPLETEAIPQLLEAFHLLLRGL